MWTEKHYDSVEQLIETNPIWKNFALLCKIPHPSFGEKELSNFLLGWARALGLDAFQDKYCNLLIRKPATAGYEKAPTVMLQAHLDMVCEKAPNVEHDFQKDPILMQLDGDLLSTGGRTTLGADDGIGVAYAMAILEDESLAHPALEVLFTTAEEEDLSGAQGVDASTFSSRLLINIDNAVEHELLAGSCGGMGVELRFPIEPTPRRADEVTWEVKIEGLPGGHSGEDINRGHGNANVLLGRLLFACRQQFPLRVQNVMGGSFRLALPREASATIFLPDESVEKLQKTVEKFARQIRKEYGAVAPALSVTATQTINVSYGASDSATRRFLTALYLSPNGISEMNNAVPGVVESSDNLGEVRIEEDEFLLVYEIRASLETTREYIYQKIGLLAEAVAGKVCSFAEYPSWEFLPDSPLRQLTSRIYEREFQDAMRTLVVHSGLECGCFAPKMPGLDAISIGPDAWGLHSPQERISVSSSDRVYHLLVRLLQEIHE